MSPSKTPRKMLGMRATPRGSPCNSEPLATPRGGNLGEISERLVGRRASGICLVGRCHKAPQRTLEQDYQLSSKVLGTGYSGSVRLATARRGNAERTVAVKTFRTRGLKGAKKVRLQSEIEVFLCMDHPHVARLLDVYETEAQLSLVMECMEGGELFDRVAQVKRFTESGAADAARQMLLALNYLHSHGMVHRDLKLENFLYDGQGSNHLKMIDFGFSKYTDSRARMRTSCGTLAYVAPEVLNRSYTSQCDLWSMGVIVFILLSGQMPFHSNADSEHLIKEIKRGQFTFKPDYWGEISEEAKEFTRSLLEVDTRKRLSATAALSHRWIVQNYEMTAPKVQASVIDALSCWSKAPKLQRVCMSMMAWTLTNSQHAKVRDSFLALDTDQDGYISPAELRQVMEGQLQMTQGDSQAILEALDGMPLRYSDFLAAMMSSCIDLDEALLQSTFHKLDIDDSGFIDSRDLRGIVGDTFEGHKVELLVDEADDLKIGKIGYVEFSKYARSYHPGTLLKKSCAECPHDQELAGEEVRAVDFMAGEEVRAVDFMPTVENARNQPCCCVVQ